MLYELAGLMYEIYRDYTIMMLNGDQDFASFLQTDS